MRYVTVSNIRQTDLSDDRRDYLPDAWHQVPENERKADHIPTKRQMRCEMDKHDER